MKKIIRVSGAIILKEGKVFCAQHSANTVLPLLWQFPGGKIEDCETPEEALKREIKEEMDCSIQIEYFFDSSSFEYDFGIVELTTFLCSLKEKEPILLEHHDSVLLPAADLENLEWAPADIPAVSKLLKLGLLK